MQAQFETLKSIRGYKLARWVRHESTNHYTLKAARNNLEFVSERANYNLYLHKLNGNSFYPMGEEVMFVARMNRAGANFSTREEGAEGLKLWFDWNIEANKWLHKAHSRFLKELVLDSRPKEAARKKSYWFKPELVGEAGEPRIPLFYRKGA